MKYLPLIWRNLLRRKARTFFTTLSILVAFILFGLLMTIRVAFSLGVDLAGADRLVQLHKVGFLIFLPLGHKDRIAQVPGVKEVTYQTWFGGIYQDPSNFFAQMAVDPEAFLRMYPEFKVPPDQAKAWIDDRTGAMVGRALAERFGWKLGDRIPLQGTIFNTGRPWEFTIDAIYDGEQKGTDTTQFLFHYDFLREAGMGGQSLVGWYVIRVADPQQAAQIAQLVDAQFANSAFETKTSTEKAFVQGFAKQIGDIGAIMVAISVAVLFTILLVAGNTMAQSIRERTNELAVLKTVGFSDGRILGLVLAESCAIAIIGGGIGLALGWAITERGDPTGGMLPAFYLPGRDLGVGVGLIVLLGLLAGILPAWQASRLRIVDALRRN
ncbi:MAG: FtsX-like permease family protein [Acidobacteria bacterium]|nr:FtsX-like permease family protein [Acidobacteriota bacterium]